MIATPNSAGPDLGVVVPAHNEEQNVATLVLELRQVLDAAGCSYELLLVDDGSTDATPDIIREFARNDRRVRGLILTRNFGHQAAGRRRGARGFDHRRAWSPDRQ